MYVYDPAVAAAQNRGATYRTPPPSCVSQCNLPANDDMVNLATELAAPAWLALRNTSSGKRKCRLILGLVYPSKTTRLDGDLASARSLFNWMVKHGRIERNPLALVQKVQSNGEQLRPRRAFTREEFQRLLSVAGPRRALYLTAVFTGLRRGELAALEWDDLDLDAERPFLKARASTTMNHKEAVIGLHRDVVAELRLIRSGRQAPDQPVFEGLMPRMKRFRTDLKRANVAYINSRGQRADFHSLSYTLATNLALAGTPPRVAMEIMSHSDMRLTAKTYTDAGLLAVWDKVANLPSFATGGAIEDSQIDSQNSQIDSQKLVRTSPSVSIPVKENV